MSDPQAWKSTPRKPPVVLRNFNMWRTKTLPGPFSFPLNPLKMGEQTVGGVLFSKMLLPVAMFYIFLQLPSYSELRYQYKKQRMPIARDTLVEKLLTSDDESEHGH
eukprot:gnl/Spiro4/9189_TR4835_c0_g1_i2.p1 gnl/Spiro4/9189_TR4835_c0_g1~~gnl/Spiro4/9189_TR4835_c0_g1_i2.p1  ORF type:complete len:123 (+),score=20.44 gnl/Spiro4/9189_TR4835_c0_g1_i2:53-370(+)